MKAARTLHLSAAVVSDLSLLIIEGLRALAEARTIAARLGCPLADLDERRKRFLSLHRDVLGLAPTNADGGES